MLKFDPVRPTFRKVTLALLTTLMALPLHAAPIDAGTILQQAQPTPLPQTARSAPNLRIDTGARAAAAAGQRFHVSRIEFRGNTVLTEAQVQEALGDFKEGDLTLADLDNLAERVTQRYQAAGYPLSRAYVPPQEIRAGVVVFELIEARFGRIDVDNQSRVDPALPKAVAAPLRSGDLIIDTGLQRAVLLMLDIPGVKSSAVLKPGEAVGTADLTFITTDDRAVQFNLLADNYGNSSTGRVRTTGALVWNGPRNAGDQFTATVLTSGHGLNYGRVSYEVATGLPSLRAGAALSDLRYVLGDRFAALNGSGTAEQFSGWLHQALVRSLDWNLLAQLQVDKVLLRDVLEASNSHNDRHLDLLAFKLNGDVRSDRGLLAWTAGVDLGRIGFDNAAAAAVDLGGAATVGRFHKVSASMYALQTLDVQDTLYAAGAFQVAHHNLDSSQKFFLGGAASVRAYDTSVASGDSGYLLTTEWRHALTPGAYGQPVLVGFVDAGAVIINADQFSPSVNRTTLAGAGVGVNWTTADALTLKAYLAHPVGPEPMLGGISRSTHAWMELGKGF